MKKIELKVGLLVMERSFSGRTLKVVSEELGWQLYDRIRDGKRSSLYEKYEGNKNVLLEIVNDDGSTYLDGHQCTAALNQILTVEDFKKRQREEAAQK